MQCTAVYFLASWKKTAFDFTDVEKKIKNEMHIFRMLAEG